jgi:hypothetical protein
VNQRDNPTIARKRRLAAEAIRTDPARSDRGIAHDLDVSRELVARVRRELAAAGENVLGLPVRRSDGQIHHYLTRHVVRSVELDRLHHRLYRAVQVVESEEFARTYRGGSRTERDLLKRIVERLRVRLDELERR